MKKFNFIYDSELELFINEKTRLPITLFFNEQKNNLTLLDQSKIPYEVKSWVTNDWKEAATKGIKGMIIRGSQAIGVAGAYCMVLAVNSIDVTEINQAKKILFSRANEIKESRPTAVNLVWAINRILEKIGKSELNNSRDLKNIVIETANQIFIEDLILNNYLRKNGIKSFKSGDVVLTHCNAGSLATTYGGSALSILSEAFINGDEITVVSKETRPRSQGFKITLWELNRVGIPVIAITDNMVSKSISKFKINKVLVGADRITKDGYVTNKIGTYDVARIAFLEKIPFYVAASHSTLDLDNYGNKTPIEERDKDEIRAFYQYESDYLVKNGFLSNAAHKKWPPDFLLSDSEKPKKGEIKLYNPAFDTTPAKYISKIIMDIDIFNPSEIIKLSWEKIYNKINYLKTSFKI